MDATDPQPTSFLVFGDLHGRVLPAFRLASCWAKDHGRPLAGVLQVGDLGYFPDISRMDKATLRHAKDDPLELGTLDIVEPNELADNVFGDPHAAPGLWFTAGNHEDFDELERLASGSGRQPDFVVDAYCRVRGIKDGAAVAFDDGPRIGAVWGVDGGGPNARQNLPPRGYIQPKAIDRLLDAGCDVLLTHDAPAGARRVGYGSELVRILIEFGQPVFVFFGHYHGDGSRIDQDFGRTEVYHLAGFEMRTRDGRPESGSVGVLEWADGNGRFEFVPDDWLKTFTRHNWKWR
jgi:hypothetical protein